MTPRSLQMPRSRRGLLATVVALLVIAVAALSAIAAIQIEAGHSSTALGDVHDVARWLGTHDWNAFPVFFGGIVLAVLGVLLLLGAFVPPPRQLIRLTDLDEHTASGIARRSLPRDLESVAMSVDGITRAKAKLRRRRVKVTVRSNMRDRSGLADAVDKAVDARLTELAPAHPLKVRTRVVGKES